MLAALDHGVHEGVVRCRALAADVAGYFQWARRGDARLPFYRWMSNILNPFVALTKCLESTVLQDKKLSDSQLRANRE